MISEEDDFAGSDKSDFSEKLITHGTITHN